jgi:SAM-dependent methyltransferase
MLNSIQYRILRRIAAHDPTSMTGAAYVGKSKLRVLLGDNLLRDIASKTVIDFGCGDGAEAIELAQHAAHVIGVDIRDAALDAARSRAAGAGVSERCTFTREPMRRADAIVSLDSFEHFADPEAILQRMYDLLSPGGFVATSFGPTWFHPYGGHLFSVFPWAHLVFSEAALIRWRSDIRSDGATRFSEVEGGLNQMTIRRFERLVKASPFKLDFLEAVAIRKLRPMHCRLTREFTTAIVRAKLVKAA